MADLDLTAITRARAQLVEQEAARNALEVRRAALLAERETLLRTGGRSSAISRIDDRLGQVEDDRNAGAEARADAGQRLQRCQKPLPAQSGQ